MSARSFSKGRVIDHSSQRVPEMRLRLAKREIDNVRIDKGHDVSGRQMTR